MLIVEAEYIFINIKLQQLTLKMMKMCLKLQGAAARGRCTAINTIYFIDVSSTLRFFLKAINDQCFHMQFPKCLI